VIIKRKLLPLGMVLLLAALGTGCSGINASHSVSPATFLIPGLLKAEPQVETLDPTLPSIAPPKQVASK
jgi:hypothetical protein